MDKYVPWRHNPIESGCRSMTCVSQYVKVTYRVFVNDKSKNIKAITINPFGGILASCVHGSKPGC
uniref:Uncharacterized protein n=1 Tax=Glossina palpalis gambiensis TaxID=67801 RepID=A0A1B0BES5_9MUSC